MKEIFPYKKSIDSKVVKAASEILGVPVISSSRLKGGVVNYVYKLKTAERTVVVKVFRNRFWPEDGKLQWIEKQFAKHKVPHAKMIYYSRNNKYFLFGLMISEYVAGLNAMEAVKKGVHTMADSYKATGNLLKRVHKIKLKKFGQINYGKGTDSNFINRELKKATGLIEKLIHHKNLKHEILNKFISAVRNGLEPFKKRFKPVLIHGDATRDNSILANNGEFILIDWDNAKSNIALWDYFVLTSWWPIGPEFKNPAKKKELKQAFFDGYGRSGFTNDEIEHIEPAIHLLIYAAVMDFFLFNKKDYKSFGQTRKQFEHIIRKIKIKNL
ncbi:MAG: aminoglycoside phosphotransferase family protein [Candidatus Doudnabacteria bacterium]